MLGLDRHNRSRVIAAVGAILFSGNYDDQDVAKVYRLSMAVNQRIKAFAASIGALDEFVYLPYADATQDPLGSYGKKNSDHIRRVAKHYDPSGFFQRRVPGGFKISRVGNGRE